MKGTFGQPFGPTIGPTSLEAAVGALEQFAISDADISRSRADPRYKQILLAKSLESCSAAMHRLQNGPSATDPQKVRELRDGAMMAVKLADMIRTIDERLGPAPEAGLVRANSRLSSRRNRL